jgi:hypothetical protein
MLQFKTGSVPLLIQVQNQVGLPDVRTTKVALHVSWASLATLEYGYFSDDAAPNSQIAR